MCAELAEEIELERRAEFGEDAPVETDVPVGFKVTKEWVMAGKAIFTVSNGKGEHYTFKVTKKDNDAPRPPVWFVSLLTGQDNESDYTYVGCLRPTTGNVDLTRASRYNRDSKPYKVIVWAMRILWAGVEFPAGYGCDGEGRCGRCGIKLTHPDGINNAGYRLGYGPTCWAKINA
jgi:hypothetical protein